MKKNYHPLFASSANPEKLSLTIKGFIVAVVPLIVIIAKANGFELAQTDFAELINQATMIGSGVMVSYGLIRKIYNTFRQS